ncbi:small-subunit processome [Aspergillus karnatakaensis]|uniref:rRNA-processing protein UTP11 n=1 Tax=Aspergillus karnatakaensis TaxID=1810916 RepID=UPI003CCCDF9E
MSSMRNAVQRRNHRERGQLKGREKWGILEKHKDYSLRAKDYNTKKQKIKRLEEKAHTKNPDEFAFGMMSSHSATKGKHGTGMRDSATAQGLSNDAIKLLKTQDAGYLRTIGEKLRRQIERVEEEVKVQENMRALAGDDEEGDAKQEESDDDDFDFDFGGTETKARKVVFADDREEQRVFKMKQELEKMVDDEDEDSEDDSFGALQKKQVKKSKKELELEKKALYDARRARKMKKRALEWRQNKLKALQKQYADITSAERALDLQRAKMSNSIGGVNKNGLKFKIKERKR